MSETVTDVVPPLSRRRLPGALWLLLLIALALAAPLAWKAWSAHGPAVDPSFDLGPEALDARLLQVESVQAAQRRMQDTLNQRLTDTRARTGLLRDEVLAVTQRSSLLEESVRDISAGQQDGLAAMRLDEVELLLVIAQQRQLGGDLPGAIRATELAQGVLATQPDPGLLDLRQTLAQELAALRAAPKNPLAVAAAELDALEAVLPKLATDGALGDPRDRDRPAASGLERLLDSLVQVRRGGDQDLLSPADRSAGHAALALEIALARTALARHDEPAFRRSVARINGWLQRLFADSRALRERRQHVSRLASLDLDARLSVAGTSLQQIQDLQRSRRGGR